MKLKTTLAVKPELVASKDDSRPVLTKIHLNAEAGEIQVTDSYMAARFPVEIEDGDTSGPIPVDALKAMRKPPLKNVPTRIALNGKAEVFYEEAAEPFLSMSRESADYTFPDLPRLYPDDEPVFEIELNAKMLHDLAKAMGDDQVRLRFTSPLKTIRVDPFTSRDGDDAPSGILMPIRLP